MLARCENMGVSGIVVWNNDWEKIDSVLKLCELNPGYAYCAVGVHPNNIKRTNDRAAADRMSRMEDLAVLPHMVAIACGLDYSREIAAHFPQEKMLESQLELAARVRLPVIVNAIDAWEQLLDKLKGQPSLRGGECLCLFEWIDSFAAFFFTFSLTLPS